MSDEKKLPKRRFKQFLNTPSWEQRKLGDVIERFEYGLNAAAIDYDGVHKYIRITDIDDASHKFLGSNLTTPKIDFQNTDTEMYKLKEGDILFARTGASVGKTYLYDINDGDLYFAGFLIRGRVNSSNNSKFVYQNTLTENYDLFIKITSQRSGQPGVNSKEYAEFKLYIPSKEEQDKISSVLTDFDNLITLHQRKLNKLEKLKKAYLEELFPTGDQRKPTRRFKEFNDDWEQRKLCEVAEITMGQSPSSKNYTDNPEDFILVQGNADLKNGAVVPRLWTKEVTKTAEANSIILTVRAPVGEVAISGYDVVLGRGVAGIKGNDFIYYVLLCLKEFHYWEKLSSGSTFDSINSNDIKEILINMPDEKEQEVITSQLKNVDNLITLHQRKLKKLKKLKEAYLDELFV